MVCLPFIKIPKEAGEVQKYRLYCNGMWTLDTEQYRQFNN